jgi:hypothetical protein
MPKRTPIPVIEHSYDLVNGSFYCPACGAALMRPEEDLQKCPHVLFAWIDQAGGMIESTIAPSVAPLIAEFDAAELDASPHNPEFVQSLPPRTVVFILWECYGPSGMFISFAIELPGNTP